MNTTATVAQLERALRVAEARAERAEQRMADVEKLLAITSFGLFEWENVDKREVLLSSSFLNLLGLPGPERTVDSDFLRAYLHPDDQERVRACYQEAIHNSGRAQYLARLKLAGDQWRTCEISVLAQRSPEGITRLLLVARDVHEKQQLREQFEENLLQLQFVVDAASAGVWDWPDTTAEYAEITSSMKKVLGYAEEDVLKNSILFFGENMHPDDLENATRTFEESLVDPNNNYRVELRLLTKQGDYRWMRSLGKVQHLGEPGKARITGAVFDIHEEKSLQLQLKEALQKLELVIDAVGAGVYDVPDTREAPVMVDPSWLNLFGYDSKDIESLKTELPSLIHPDDLPFLYEYQSQLLESSGKSYDSKFRLRRKDGQYRWVRSRGLVAKINEPDHFRITGAMFDVHDMHLAEAKLKEAHDNLECYSYVIAHDLMAPLRYIDSFGEILEEELNVSPLDKNADIVKRIRESAQRAQAMISSLLEFSRVGNEALQMEEVNLNEVVESLRTMLDVHEVINWSIAPLPTVQGDRVQLAMLFQNVIANAVKFSNHKGDQAKVEIFVHKQSAHDVEICIRDNGIGFPSEMAERIFDVFARASTHNHLEGTGIGLANVARIASRHGGKVRAEGCPDKGAAVYICLPFVQ